MEKAVTGGKPPVHVKHFKNDNNVKAIEQKCMLPFASFWEILVAVLILIKFCIRLKDFLPS